MPRGRSTPVRKVVGTSDRGRIFRMEYCDVRFWHPWHFHPEIEIKHVIRGSGTRVVADSVEPFSDGDLCIVGSGTPHSWTSSAEKGRWVRARVVQLSPELFGTGLTPGPFAEVAKLLRRSELGLEISGPTRAEAVSELDRLFEANTEARMLAHLHTSLAIVSDSPHQRVLSIQSPEEPKDGPRRQLTAQVLAFVKSRFHLPLTEEEAAQEFGQSPSAFSRLFQREFGKSFSRYVTELRVARASNLLLGEPLTVREIARLSGFGTVASLNRHFRTIKMTTPLEYRRRGRELNRGLRAAEGEILRCDSAGRRRSDDTHQEEKA